MSTHPRVARDSLMKKGLRLVFSELFDNLFVARDSLMKKGLRRRAKLSTNDRPSRERFPDEEGIKTDRAGEVVRRGRERFPDEEGIKTITRRPCL